MRIKYKDFLLEKYINDTIKYYSIIIRKIYDSYCEENGESF